jgi:hypothetical protein
MIAPWPRKSPHAKAAKRLREAVNTTAHTDALADFVASTYASTREASTRLQEMRDTVTQAVTDIDALLAGLDAYSRTAKQARGIRDDLDALINESDRP